MSLLFSSSSAQVNITPYSQRERSSFRAGIYNAIFFSKIPFCSFCRERATGCRYSLRIFLRRIFILSLRHSSIGLLALVVCSLSCHVSSGPRLSVKSAIHLMQRQDGWEKPNHAEMMHWCTHLIASCLKKVGYADIASQSGNGLSRAREIRGIVARVE